MRFGNTRDMFKTQKVPELDIPDDFKCIVQTELIKHAKMTNNSLSLHRTTLIGKTTFLTVKEKKKKKPHKTSRCLDFLNNQQKNCLEKRIPRSKKLVCKTFMPKLGQKPPKSAHHVSIGQHSLLASEARLPYSSPVCFPGTVNSLYEPEG